MYDMSWAEFILRSIGFKKKLEREEKLARVIAYQSYCSQFAFSKKKPKPIDQFWKIGDSKKSKSLSEDQRLAYMKQVEEYEKQKKSTK